MSRFLKIAAVSIALLAGAIWLTTGANRGWTKTTVPIKTVDEVTGIEGVTYEKRFVAGVDFLGAALLGAAALAGISYFVKPKHKKS